MKRLFPCVLVGVAVSLAVAQAGPTPAEITAAAKEFAKKEQYKANPNTHCSEFVRDVVNKLVGQPCAELDGQAKDQIKKLGESNQWEKLNIGEQTAEKLKQAHEAANTGKIVIVTYLKPEPGENNTGHVAIVVPAPQMEASGKWDNMDMPFIAQAGNKNPRGMAGEEEVSVFASLKMSYGFKKDHLPQMAIFIRRDPPVK